MKMLKLEILEEKTRILFDKLATHWYDFPLVWGTWLSLQIWHRTSVDLDFVVPRFVNHKDIQIFRKLSQNLEIVYQSKEQINMFVDGVKVTIFSYWWKESFPLKKYKKLKIRDLRDIAISKSFSIWRREEIKDYIDLYFVLNEKFLSMDELIEFSKNKYNWDFSEKLFLKQLLLLEEIEQYEINYLRDEVSIKTIDDFFIDLVKKRV